MQWFNVDRKGLAALLERKGKEFILFELVQNAWDEKTTRVDVTLERIAGTRMARLTVSDNNPTGFSNLDHSFTLFAESAKKSDAEKRGRFNLGEKLVLALCDEASITTTTGTIVFDAQGRHAKRAKTEAGSVFTGILQMTTEDIARCGEAIRTLIPPANIRTIYNGIELQRREVMNSVEATLPTEVANEEGLLRSAQRMTRIDIYEPLPGETPMLLEMGIPVVATGDRWHLNVQQKVPLTFDRDNVPPAYLSKVRALAVETMSTELTTEDANAAWVREAVQRHGASMTDATIGRLTTLRFGDKRVAYDPSDPEANNLAIAQGYTVVHGGQMAKAEWDEVRRAGAILPAGQVTPSPKPYSESGDPLKVIAEADWTSAMRTVVNYLHDMAHELLDCPILVTIVSDITWPYAATYGDRLLTLNLGRIGHKWFHGPLEGINELMLHEFGHHYSRNHLSSEYHDALTMLGAKLTRVALEMPALFNIR